MKSLIALFLSTAFAAANPLIVVSGSPPVAGVAAAWYDSIAPASTDSSTNLTTGFIMGATITPTTSGTCTKLRIRLGEIFADSTIKMAIYTSGGTLVASGSVATGASGLDTWVEVTMDAGGGAVTASTLYKIGFVASAEGNSTVRYLAGAASGAGLDEFTYIYSTFPPGTISFNDATSQFSLGMYVE